MEENLIGHRFNKLTVVGLYEKDKSRKNLWRCRCDCGGEIKTNSQNLKSSKIKDCGCSTIKEDLSGKRFGFLSVIKRLPNTCERKNLRTSIWLCECDCGKVFEVNGSDLTQRRISSCGCDKEAKEQHLSLVRKKENKNLYYVYRSMKDRCNNPKHKNYQRYGARGIKVCKEWNYKYGFPSFHKWAIANGYKDGLTIDRIDNDGNYEPSNCRWVTRKEQAHNFCTNVYAEYNGERKILQDWEKELNLPPCAIYYHYRKGRSIEEIISFFDKKRAKHEIPTNKICQMA